MALSVSVKNHEAEKIVEAAKIKAIKSKVSLSEAVIRLLDKWSKGEVDITGGKK